MATIVSDTFTAGDGTDISGRTPSPTAPGGATWSERAGNWQITSNAAVSSTANNSLHCTVDSGVADCTITAEVDSTTSLTTSIRDAGLVARWSDTSNYWKIGINNQDNAFRIVERNATVMTTRATASVTINGGTFYTVQAVLSGDDINATLDGANGISYGSATLNQTATVHGFAGRETTDRIDDFLVETASGTNFPQSADGTLTTAGTVARSTAKFATGTLTSAGALLRTVGKVVAGTLTTAGALVTSLTYLVTVAGTLTSAGTLSRSTSKLLDGTLTSAGALLRNTAKVLAGTLTSAGTLARATAKTLAGTLTGAGALVSSLTFLVAIGGTLTTAGTLARNTAKTLAGTLPTGGTLNRAISKAFAGTLSFVGSLIAAIVGGEDFLLDVEISDSAVYAATITDSAVYTVTLSDTTRS